MLDNLISAAQKGNIHITFKSLISGRDIREIYTLKGVDIPLNPNSEKIIFLHVNSGVYEDIQKDTITEWGLTRDHPNMKIA